MVAAAMSIIPIIASRNLPKMSPLQKPVQAWIESLSQVEDKKIGMIDLHPSIFNVNPRLDILARNVYWQQMYGKIVSK
jgi:large subunit ribosomal protein L4